MFRNLAVNAVSVLGFSVLLSTLVFAQNAPAVIGPNLMTAGIFVTPVPNVPFSATVIMESTRPLPDGTTESLKTRNNIARDAAGRIHNEQRRLLPASSNETPQLLSTHIFDPETRISSLINPFTRIVRQSVLPGTANTAPPSGIGSEDLGTKIMENLVVHGFRRTTTVPPAQSATGKAVVITHEIWYSEDLHLNLLIQHSDPRTGEQTLTVTEINRADPNAQLFEIPAGYKVVDETPEKQ